mmetsp:Transcript_118018/g.252058  ORF Transcript_118018/g.252058 Transcript_118018/m.252058 type:complete len:211 (+) Transcript_118018:128-760(+)
MSGFFRGTSTDQVKHVNAEQKLIKKLAKEGRFPEHFSRKVDITKVSMEVIKPWIAQRITELMGFEDEVVVEYCISNLEEARTPENDKGLDPKLLQVNMTAFMERKAAPFCSELWTHLLSAQASPVGVPQEFIDKKKEDLQKKRDEAERVQDELKRRRKDLEDAARGGEGGSSRGGGGGRDREERRDRGRSDRSDEDDEDEGRSRRKRRFE